MNNVGAFLAFDEARTWSDTFTRETKKWLKKTVMPVEPVAGMLARAYVEKARAVDYVQANIELRKAAGSLQRRDLNLSWPDDELVAWCERRAARCHDLLRQAELTDSLDALNALCASGVAILNGYGMPLPDIDEIGPLGFLKRLADAKWWRLQARRFQRREVERLAILLRRVRKGREIYCSDETVRRRSAQRLRNRRYLENTEAENQDGQRYTLAELSDLSVSNPKIKRGELMLRIRGFDEVAELLGHVREFWTFTTPSRFHKFTTVGQVVRDNKHWDGSTPKDAQSWLSACWARIRAALARVGVRVYGFRVVEAHHDGTPHWHAAVFYKPTWPVPARFSYWPRIPTKPDDDNGKGKTGVEFSECELGRSAAPRVRAIVRRYLLEEEKKKVAEGVPGAVQLLKNARAHRCDFKAIDPEKGDAAGYLAKYITKAIDAADAADLVQADLYGYDMGESARRVEAWASCWGVRQFQQIGGPSVSAWRELRRAMSDDVTQFDLFDAPLPVQQVANAADSGDWQAFVLLMGGPCVKRDDQLVRLGYWHEYDKETGECVGRVMNRYGETAEAALFGLTYNGGESAILTRVHTWTIHRPGEEKAETPENKEFLQQVRKLRAVVDQAQEFKPWAFDVLRAFDFGFSGAPPGAPLEFCQ